ncbi:uracil-DNA glycosylase [Reinekea sp.]|jgi:uracil-DNA glycosylase|uniref:uracil-DNA glycosylase n=1 Tax=Reinekea sp. TaxID=1970455 RepID=UPI002A7FA735|nr:uracil-DNA glycosylase [Reinekea sp.]
MAAVLDLLESVAWRRLIEAGMAERQLRDLSAFLSAQKRAGQTLYPAKAHWFRALDSVAPDQVRVVILGQDPYHGANQAQGLSFSVPPGHKLPPSLANIFKELATDLGIDNASGDLSGWSEQGVLLLNAVLTVTAGQAGSHAKQGWEVLTDAVIAALSAAPAPVVFMLWGAYAQKKRLLIDTSKHLVLSAAHPSPLSAYRGWFGSRHFSQANCFLQQQGHAAIDWRTAPEAQQSLW